MKLARIFCCRPNFKEKLFFEAEKLYMEEIDIVNILRKLQEIEKMKLILLNPKQLALFDVLAKPMVYIDERRFSTPGKESGYKISQMINSHKKNNNLKETIEFYENPENRVHWNEIDLRLVQLLDSNLKDFLKYFQ